MLRGNLNKFNFMPRKTIHRFLPNMNRLLEQPSLRWLKSLATDPNLFHLNRQSVSLAAAVGIFCAFMPLPGQTLLAIFLCYWLGANLPIGALTIWISNPITIPPMFYLSYQLGIFLLGIEPIRFTVQIDWQWFKSIGADILLPLFVGSILCGIIFATIGYFVVFYLWRWKVLKNWQERRQRRLFK